MKSPTRPNENVWLWLAKILTGAFIIVVLAIHLVVNHLVAPDGLLNYADVVAYLGNPWVVVMETIFLVLVVSHALMGLRSIVLDLNPPRTIVRVLDGLFIIGGAAAVIYGIWLLHLIASMGGRISL